MVVEIPISAPSPNSEPSAKRVEALTMTELESIEMRSLVAQWVMPVVAREHKSVEVAVGDLVDLATEDGFVAKTGAWFSYGDVRLGQGRENAKQFLRDNPDLAQEIETSLRIALGLPTFDKAEEPAEVEA